MSKTTTIAMFLFTVAAVSGSAQAQYHSLATQTVAFGVVRNAASVEETLSSMDAASHSGSVRALRKSLESIPAKITVSFRTTSVKGPLSNPVQTRRVLPPTDVRFSPSSIADTQRQTDLKVLLSEHRSLRVDSTPLIVTITD